MEDSRRRVAVSPLQDTESPHLPGQNVFADIPTTNSGQAAERRNSSSRPYGPSSPQNNAAGTAESAKSDGTVAVLPTPVFSPAHNTVSESDEDPDAIPASRDPNIAIHLRNVSKTYLLGVEGVPALRGVSLTVRKGDFLVILGKSGGGKTSLLNILGTIDRPTRGDLYICGARIDSKTADSTLADIRLRRLGFVFQTFNLLPGLTALENVELPMILARNGSASSRRKRAIRLLTRVGLSERLHHVPSMMSGGEQQRTTIARALSNRPDILLLDEPTGDLDGNNSHLVLKILTDLNRKEKVTCIMVTHDVALKNYAHRVVHMVDGKISRIEEIPSFVRDSAMEALDTTPAVLAMQELERRKRAEMAVERSRLGGGAVFAGADDGDDLYVDDDAGLDGHDVSDATLAAVNRDRQVRFRGTPSAGGGGVLLAFTAWLRSWFQRSTIPVASPASTSSGGARFSINGTGPHPVALNQVSIDAAIGVVPPRSSVANPFRNPLSTTVSPSGVHAVPAFPSPMMSSTSTGLSGVAAISHALFANESGGTPSAGGGPATTVRSPEDYPTYTYALKAQAEARKEEEDRRRAQEAKEKTLRETILAHHNGRLAHAPTSVAQATTRDFVESLGASATLRESVI